MKLASSPGDSLRRFLRFWGETLIFLSLCGFAIAAFLGFVSMSVVPFLAMGGLSLFVLCAGLLLWASRGILREEDHVREVRASAAAKIGREPGQLELAPPDAGEGDLSITDATRSRKTGKERT